MTGGCVGVPSGRLAHGAGDVTGACSCRASATFIELLDAATP
jgi:hypothetical protein